MRRFEPVVDGWQSALSTWEREYVAGLLEQVAAVLTAEGPLEALEGLDDPAGPAADDAPARPQESEYEAAVLAALDFHPSQPATDEPHAQEPGQARADRPVVAPDVASLLEVLLPDASEDPQVAVEVSAMTRERLRVLKHTRLVEVASELLEPTGEDGAVLVRRGQEPVWLAALNDVRLVLAQRLGIEDAAAAEEVHAVAWEDVPDDEPEEARWRRGLAMSYDMLTWWQESLLAVLWAGEGRA